MLKWWSETNIYHIYPRSFKDSSGSGIGDISGVINKLDYIKETGFETVWLSPFFLSPGSDHGYDISDYYKIDPLMGSDGDVTRLINEIHNREMRVVFDLVLNHTSIEHPWFIESCKKNLSKADWYIWAKGRGKNRPPNNWKTMTGRRGWTYSSERDEWFYSSFLNFQPDLNYRNPEVKKEMFRVVNYWLKRGVDGFRLDIFNCIGKDEELKDNPYYPRLLPSPEDNQHCFLQNKINNFNHPLSVSLTREIREEIDKFPDKFLLGEVSGDHKSIRKYTEDKGLNLIFMFELVHFKYSKKYFYNFLKSLEEDFPAPYTPVLSYSNHDNGRGISRVGNSIDKWKNLSLIQLTSRGVPVIYYGEEVGMINHNLQIAGSSDPQTQGFKLMPRWLPKLFNIMLNRENGRTPMMWDSSKNRGFTKGDVNPWIPVTPGSVGRDVDSQNGKDGTLLELYKTLLHLRRESPEIRKGDLKLFKSDKNILIYSRTYKKSSLLIVVNFSRRRKKVPIIKGFSSILLSTKKESRIEDDMIILEGNSSLVLRDPFTDKITPNPVG